MNNARLGVLAMKNRKKQFLMIFLVLSTMTVFGFLQYAKGQEDKPHLDKATADALEKYVPSDFNARQKKLEELCDDHRRTAHALLLIIDRFKNDRMEQGSGCRVAIAIQMLGKLRMELATIPLLDMIERRYPGIGRLRSPVDPIVIQALIEIGKPASKAAVEYLARDKSSKRAPMYVRVIAQVEGVEVGAFMVRKAMEREKDPDRKARLEKALELFQNADQPVP
jgi:hypothetical protein